MCVIIAIKKGIELPSKETFENCFDRNRDGAGFAYNLDGKVYISKGYMKFDAFWADFTKAMEKRDKKKMGVVVHARISTQGGVVPRLCHPFPMSSSGKELSALSTQCDVAVAHNGIIPSYKFPECKADKVSDTYLFIKKYMATYEKGWFKKDKHLNWLKDVTGSKWAFLTKNGDIFMTNNFIEKDGVFYSNDSYRGYTYNSWDYWYRSFPTTPYYTRGCSAFGDNSKSAKVVPVKKSTSELPWEDRWTKYNESIGYRGVLKLKELQTRMNISNEDLMSILDVCSDVIDERVDRLLETEMYGY